MSAMDKKVVTLVYGCQMSERDAQTLSEISGREGYERSEDPNTADLIIINTCCVRESAENKILGKIGELKKLKEKNPELKIAVTGCMVQQPGALERLRKRAPHVDIWAGTHNLHDFARQLKTAQRSGKSAEVWPEARGITESVPLAEKGKLKANVNIMYGCDNYCTYCIVPYVRGRERSRPAGEILAEIEALAESGCREVTLLGQNVNSYGEDLSAGSDFPALLREVDQIPGLLRVRFTTSHPKDLSDQLIDTLAGGRHLCHHIHLPVQAGSDKILRRMNRKYTREYYLNRVRAIRERLPASSITTDIIVGFPGETEEDFSQTLAVVRQVHYSQAFTFMFSRRSGTPAFALPDQVPLEVKKRRLQELMQVQNEESLKWRQNMLDKTWEVLVEGPSKSNPERLMGRTRGNEVVVFSGTQDLSGQPVAVKAQEANSWTLFGELA
ncbi:tRNA-2-methylthio-N(6)-dimethylallyladenosine synthase [Peptococcaceae bacterium CEB3]|nr:tRNA-2-methylthio-N(6)-dimethylallyladenosine synthase [Peptococcaceae bacterium CEB3]